MSTTGGASSGWTKGTWIRRCLVTLIILGLGASSYYFYKQSRSRSTVEPGQVNNPELQAKLEPKEKAGLPAQRDKAPVATRPPVRAPEKKPVQKTISRAKPFPPQTNEQLDPNRPQRPQQDLSAPTKKIPLPPPNRRSETISPPPPDSTVPVVKEKMAQAPSTPPNPIRREVVQPQPQRTPAASKPAPSTSSRKPPDPYSGLRSLSNGRLKIHAIVWSNDKEERMAVVNTQIVHEGEGVDGYAVVAIRQDDVVVRDEAGSLWKVKFGRP